LLVQQRPIPPPPLISPAVFAWLRKPQFMIPVAVVVGMIVIAFVIQPSGAEGQTQAAAVQTATAEPSTTATATATPSAAASKSATSTASSSASKTALAGATSQSSTTPNGSATVNPNTIANPVLTSSVAGVQGSPTATPADAIDLSHQTNQCGSLQEASTALSVEQAINGVSVKATRAASYPIEYFRCILMATGTQESFSLATAVSKAQTAGNTDAVLIDLWVTNAGHEFGQVSMKDAVLAGAGQTFAPIATLGGRADVVISSGQGRTVTLVVAIKNTVGGTTGPLTLTLPAPLFGGTPTAGKYSLFLPTP
jgi:hypothetical protein